MNNKEIYIKLEKAVGDNNVQEVSNILDRSEERRVGKSVDLGFIHLYAELQRKVFMKFARL